MKLVSKERVGAKLKKKDDSAKTPYQRTLNSDQVQDEHQQPLRQWYPTLNPVALLRQMEALQDAFWQHAFDPSRRDVATSQSKIPSSCNDTLKLGFLRHAT